MTTNAPQRSHTFNRTLQQHISTASREINQNGVFAKFCTLSIFFSSSLILSLSVWGPKIYCAGASFCGYFNVKRVMIEIEREVYVGFFLFVLWFCFVVLKISFHRCFHLNGRVERAEAEEDQRVALHTQPFPLLPTAYTPKAGGCARRKAGSEKNLTAA